MLVQYAAVGLLFIGAVFFACAALIVSRLLQPHNPYKQKNITYECCHWVMLGCASNRLIL